MVADWQTTYLKIEMPTYMNSDSTYVFEDRFENNPTRVAQSSYRNDGTFSAWFLTSDGVKVDETTGTWFVEKDSLQVSFFYGGKQVVTRYFIEETPEGFKGTNRYDWDNDGANDDLLLMKTKRISPKN